MMIRKRKKRRRRKKKRTVWRGTERSEPNRER